MRGRLQLAPDRPPGARRLNHPLLPQPPATPAPATFTNLRAIMLSPLPRVYEEGHSGAAVPSEPEATLIGGDVQVERLTAAAQETKKRLEIEVLQPIKQWMVAYRTILVGGLGGGAARQGHWAARAWAAARR
jgi:hypothetical protein